MSYGPDDLYNWLGPAEGATSGAPPPLDVTESVGDRQAERQGAIDWFNRDTGGAPAFTPPDPTESGSAMTEDVPRRRPINEMNFAGGYEDPTQSGLAALPETPHPTESTGLRESTQGFAENRSGGLTQTLGLGPPLPPGYQDPTESTGQPDNGGRSWWDKAKDIAGAVGKNLVSPGVVRAFEDITGGDLPKNPVKAPLQVFGDVISPVWEAGQRTQAAGALAANQIMNDFKQGNYGRGVLDAITSTIVPVQDVKYLPYVLGDQAAIPGVSRLGIGQNEYRVASAIQPNAYGAVVPGSGGSGDPKFPHGIDLPVIGNAWGDVPVLGGIGRAAGSLFDPRNWNDPRSINIDQVAQYLEQGHTIAEARQRFPGSAGTKLVSDLLNPSNFGDMGLGDVMNAFHLGAMGFTNSPIGRLARGAWSEGSLAKVDMRAATTAAQRIAGDLPPDVAAQTIIDHAANIDGGFGSAVRDLVARRGSPNPDVDLRIADAATEKWAKDWSAAGRAQTFEDYVAEQLTPSQAKIEALMTKDGLPTDPASVAKYAPAYDYQFGARALSDAAQETLGLKIVEQASGTAGQRFLDYLRTGNLNPDKGVVQTLNDIRQAATGAAKTGLLAFSPRYYMQNLVDNAIHAVLGGGFGRPNGVMTRGLEQEVRGLAGITGNKTVPTFINDTFGVGMDVGQNFAQDAAKKGARVTARPGSRGFGQTVADVLGKGGDIAGGVLEKLSPMVENPGRYAVWTREFFNKLDSEYVKFAGELRSDLAAAGVHPEVQQIAEDFIKGLSDGGTTSFAKAADWLDAQRVTDPAAQVQLDALKRTLPNQIDFINQDAAARAYYTTQRVFNNYDLHIKYFDTLMNAMFLFSKYQTRSPGFLIQDAINRPGLYYSLAQANEDMRNANLAAHPGLRDSAQERLYTGGKGFNPLGVFGFDQIYNAIAHSPNNPQDTTGLRQGTIPDALRSIQQLTQAGIGQFALPFQLAGEKAGIFAPQPTSVTTQPFVDVAGRIPINFDVPAFNVPGVSVGGEPVRFTGGQVNPAAVAANWLAPYSLGERGINAIVGRQQSESSINNLTEWMMSRIRDMNPGTDPNVYVDALRAKSGPLYQQARGLAEDYLQNQRNQAALFPGNFTLLKPDEFAVTDKQNTYFTGIEKAQAAKKATGQEWNEAIYSGDPARIARAKKADEAATEALKDAYSVGNPNINVDTSGVFQGVYFPGRSPGDPNYRIPNKQVDENGQPTKYNVTLEGPDYATTQANRYVLQTQIGANPAEEYLQKHGFPNAVLPNPVNPYSPNAVYLKDVMREAQQGFDYRDPRTGIVSHIYGDYPIADALMSKPGVTPQQALQILQEFKARGTYEDVMTGRGLTQPQRDTLLSAQAQQWAAGNTVIQGIDGRPTTIIGDLQKSGGYYDTLNKAYALPQGDARARMFDEANRILAQTPGGKAYTDLSHQLNTVTGSLDLWQQESLAAAQQKGLLAGLGWNPVKTDAQLADSRFLYRVADPATRKASIDYDNLMTNFYQANPTFLGLQAQYFALPNDDAKKAFVVANPGLKAGWDAKDAIQRRIAIDDGVDPDLIALRRDNAILAGQLPGAVARDQNSPDVKSARLFFETWNDAQRTAYNAYQDWTKTPAAQTYFELFDAAPKKGEPNYSGWWGANGDRYRQVRDTYNAGIDAIKSRTGQDPRALSKAMNTAKGKVFADEEQSAGSGTSATSGGGGTFRPTGSGQGGGSTRRSSGGGGRGPSGQLSTQAALTGRDNFYAVFDNLSSREKAALRDVDALGGVFTKGARPSAEEWKDALNTLQRELPRIRDTQTARDSYFAMMDTLTSREKALIRDLTARVSDMTASAETIKSALIVARERVRNPDSQGYGEDSRTLSRGPRLATASDIQRYGGIGQANAIINNFDLSGFGEPMNRGLREAAINGSRQTPVQPSSTGSNTTRNSEANRTTYNILTSPNRTTTKKKVA